MTDFLIRYFIPDAAAVDRPSVRKQYGMLAGTVGIGVNVLLFAVKLTIGLLSGAISIVADALNNLSDAGASVVTLLGFRLAARPADREHPFGHGRIEYLTGLFIAVVIILVGFELLRTSVLKVFSPEILAVDRLVLLILTMSIGCKFWLGFFYRFLGRRIRSAAIEAAALDSFSDCVATTVVLAGAAVNYFAGVNIDGIAGILVAVFILYSGWKAAQDTIQPLLGMAPDPVLVDGIEQLVLSTENIIGMHDMMIHNYGPGRVFVSLHAEISASMDILQAHEVIDGLEVRLYRAFHIDVTVHMDPVVVDDPETNRLRALAEQAVREVDPQLSLHDFRMTTAYSHGRNLIFDIVVPQNFALTDEELRRAVQQRLAAVNEQYHTVIHLDHQYC